MKKCTKCTKPKELSDYTNIKQAKDWKSNICRTCQNIKQKEVRNRRKLTTISKIALPSKYSMKQEQGQAKKKLQKIDDARKVEFKIIWDKRKAGEYETQDEYDADALVITTKYTI